MKTFRRTHRFLALAFAACLFALPSLQAVEAHDEAPATSSGGLRADLLEWVADAESKLLQLADATPEEKYAWRPGEGVRSQGEVFLHVAAANFGIPASWGVTPPSGFAFSGYEQSLTKKAEIRAARGLGELAPHQRIPPAPAASERTRHAGPLTVTLV